jgi:hypothetical protein
MGNKRTVSLAPEDFAVTHGHDQQAAVGQKSKPGRLLRYVGDCLRRAVHREGENAVGVEIGNVEPPVAPSRALGK